MRVFLWAKGSMSLTAADRYFLTVVFIVTFAATVLLSWVPRPVAATHTATATATE